jgi:Bacterial Ig-like domain
MFSRSFPWALLPILAILMASGCASPKAPTGGAEDMEPPAIVAEESTPNFQTNFIPEEIIITFDEWFTLKEVSSQVVISPLMPEEPEIKQKGKSVVIIVPDSLREETTYTINFGNSIACVGFH